MRKYVASAAVAMAAGASLFAGPMIAGAQARGLTRATKGKMDLVVLKKHGARQELFVQRTQHSTSVAQTASCPAGQLILSYCTPPKEDSLFGAFMENDGSATFGSTSSTTCRQLGWSGAPCGVYTNVSNELIVAFVSAESPTSGGQSITVTCTTSSGGTCPVTFHKVASENAGGGDSEVWYADATSVISKTAPIFVKAAVAKTCGRWGKGACDVALQAVTFQNAITPGASGVQGTGIGASNVCFSTKAAPSCALKTTEPDSMVWAAANDPSAGQVPTWPSGQFAIGVADSNETPGTFYTQFAGSCTGSCGTMSLPSSGLYQNPYTLSPTVFSTLGSMVTINDTAPTKYPFNEVAVEIL